MVKRLLLLCALAAMLLFASACEDGNCTQCGWEPNSQQLATYTDAQGATVTVAFWTDDNGCKTFVNCP